MPHGGDDANTILVLKADNVFRIHAYFKTFYTVKEFKKISERFGISIYPRIYHAKSLWAFLLMSATSIAITMNWRLSSEMH